MKKMRLRSRARELKEELESVRDLGPNSFVFGIREELENFIAFPKSQRDLLRIEEQIHSQKELA